MFPGPKPHQERSRPVGKLSKKPKLPVRERRVQNRIQFGPPKPPALNRDLSDSQVRPSTSPSRVPETENEIEIPKLLDSLKRIRIESSNKLPSRWVVPEQPYKSNIALGNGGLDARYRKPVIYPLPSLHPEQPFVVAECPLPSRNGVYYYEAQVLNHVATAWTMTVGYHKCNTFASLHEEGCNVHGYNVSTAQLVPSDVETNLLNGFGGFLLYKNDVLGFGVTASSTPLAFFTRNGKLMSRNCHASCFS